MQARLESRQFNVVGMKHTGQFSDYASLVPQASLRFQTRAGEIPNRTNLEVVLYQPKLGADHLEGFFYTSYEVSAKPETLPEGMEFLSVSGTYAVVRGDERHMGELYSYLDQWISDQGYTKESQNGLFIEVYDTPGSTDVEVWLPLRSA